MLKIGVLDSQSQARRFTQFLASKALNADIREVDAVFEIWLLEHEHIDQVRGWFKSFSKDPRSAQFDVKVDPKAKAKVAEAKLKQHYRRVFKRPKGALITWGLLVASTLVFLLMLTMYRTVVLQALLIVPPGRSLSILATQPWRLVTPIFIHSGVLHIIFNLFWVYDFGMLIESKESRWFFLLLVLSGAILGNFLQLFLAGPYFGGLSGVVYALFGYLWLSAKTNLRSGYFISTPVIVLLVAWLVIGFTGVLGSVANFGHLGGLLAGFLFAYIQRLRQS